MPTDARAAFSQATEMHRQGQLDAAIEIYHRLAQEQPAFHVHRLLVYALLQARRFEEALEASRRTREAFSELAEAHVLFGAAQQANRNWSEALTAYEAATVLDPVLAEAHYLAGNVLATLGRDAAAVARFSRVVALDQRATDAIANRGAAFFRLGQLREALRDGEALTRMQPGNARHWAFKAKTLFALDRFEEAERAAGEALKIVPQFADVHALRARCLLRLGDRDGAQEAFAAAVAAAPDRAAWSAEWSRMVRGQGDLDAALAICDAALAHDSEIVAVLHERAEVRRLRGDTDGACADARRTVEMAPDFAAAHATLARILAETGNAEAAAGAVRAALAADPDLPLARYLIAVEHLAHGRWQEGWEDYENRVALLPEGSEPLPFARWDGREPVSELIVRGDGGIADQILFGRLLRRVADRGIHARLLTAPRHVPLLSRIDARVFVSSDLDRVDITRPGLRWVPLWSLPGLIAPDPTLWPAAPYLTADPERVRRWRSWRLAEKPVPPEAPQPEGDVAAASSTETATPIAAAPQASEPPAASATPPETVREPRLRIGICWQGEPSTTGDTCHAVPLAAFAPLASLKDVELVCLQAGAEAGQIDDVPFGKRLVCLAPDRDADGTLVDTVGILQHLDLVVTVDGALAHLAGARGRPVFLALPAVPDWCWGREGETSALYASVRLFRQARNEDWNTLFARIAAAVEDVLRTQETP